MLVKEAAEFLDEHGQHTTPINKKIKKIEQQDEI